MREKHTASGTFFAEIHTNHRRLRYASREEEIPICFGLITVAGVGNANSKLRFYVFLVYLFVRYSEGKGGDDVGDNRWLVPL